MRLVFIVLIFWTFHVVAKTPTPSHNSTQKQLHIGLTDAPNELSGFLNIQPGQQSFLDGFLRPPMVALDLDWQWQCLLCEALPSETNGSLNYVKDDEFPFQSTWRLRERQFWANGDPITAKDVKFTLKTLFQASRKGKKDRSNSIPLFKVTTFKEDPLRFQVAFKEQRFDYFQILATSLIPHKFESQLKSLFFPTPEKRDASPVLNSPAYYYGNYYLKSFDKEMIYLASNPYKRANNSFDEIIVRRYSQAKQLIPALQRNEIDMTDDVSIGLEQLEAIKIEHIQESNQLKLIHSPSSYLEQVIINLRSPILADVNVRKALFSAIDRNQLLNRVFKNYGLVARHLIKPFENQDFDSPLQSFNIQQAQKLLDAAGWKIKDQKYRSKLKQIMSIEIATDTQPFRRDIANFLASSWQKLGIRTQVKVYKQQDYTSILASRRFRDVALLALQHYPSVPWHQRFASDYIPKEDELQAQLNIMSWESKEADKILKMFQSEVDLDKQLILQRQLEMELVKDYPIFPLVFHPRFIVASQQLSNIRLTGHRFPSSLFSETWLKVQPEGELF